MCIVIFSGRELAWLLTGSIDHQQNSRSKHARHRTDDALYEALGQVHAVRFRMLTDTALRLEFDELLHQHAGGKSKNKILFLVKLAFFPDTLQPGPGRKADLNKASRYVKRTCERHRAREIRRFCPRAGRPNHPLSRVSHRNIAVNDPLPTSETQIGDRP